MATQGPKPKSGLPRRAALAAYAGAWTLLASVYAAAFAASSVPAGMALRGAAAAILPNALLGILSLGLARRWPWFPAGRWRLAARLVPAVLGLTAAATAGWLLLILLDGWITLGAVRVASLPMILWQVVINGLIHVALTGIGYAWHTAAALRDARDLAARAEVLRTRAELQLLRSQLQPHFVNNMLHALLGLIRRDPALAESALEKLGELLRFGQWVHQSGSDFVPLSREWDFVRSYLELERVRLGDRLRVSFEADESALEVSVPPFALQPLVENAIIHGVAPRASGGRVDVSVRRSGGRLSLAVSDDGPGGSEVDIAASRRMGLRLLQERLAALYSGRAHLFFESPAGGGFRVRLDLPDDGAPELA
ncbi:MAG: sensor histidine kinase [Thermoanaerobaculia bacterium]